MHGQKDKLDVGLVLMNIVSGLDPIQDRHGYIHDYEVWLKAFCLADESLTITCHSDQIEIRLQ